MKCCLKIAEAEAMHPLVRDLYKRAITVGRDYPHSQGLNFVRETWKKALRDPSYFNINYERIKNDPLEYEKALRKAVGRGRYAIREMIGVIQMKKFRTMKRRYGAGNNLPQDSDAQRIQNACRDLIRK